MKRSNYDALDHLATMVAVTSREGRCVYVNAAFEAALGLPRRSLLGGRVADWMVDPSTLVATMDSVVRNEFSTGRFEALLRRPQGSGLERLPVHCIVTQIDHGELVLIELVEVEQLRRQRLAAVVALAFLLIDADLDDFCGRHWRSPPVARRAAGLPTNSWISVVQP